MKFFLSYQIYIMGIDIEDYLDQYKGSEKIIDMLQKELNKNVRYVSNKIYFKPSEDVLIKYLQRVKRWEKRTRKR
jgi:iron uptake system EfeUOB component EfeO/EfeM